MYIVMERSAPVSGRARDYGPYKYLAVVELDPQWVSENPNCEPRMISTRARGVKRIVCESSSVWAGGKTERSQYHQIKAEFNALADRLNNGEEIKDGHRN